MPLSDSYRRNANTARQTAEWSSKSHSPDKTYVVPLQYSSIGEEWRKSRTRYPRNDRRYYSLTSTAPPKWCLSGAGPHNRYKRTQLRRQRSWWRTKTTPSSRWYQTSQSSPYCSPPAATASTDRDRTATSCRRLRHRWAATERKRSSERPRSGPRRRTETPTLCSPTCKTTMGQLRWRYAAGFEGSVQAEKWHAVGLVAERLADIEGVCDGPEEGTDQDQGILHLKVVHRGLVSSIERAEREVEWHLLRLTGGREGRWSEARIKCDFASWDLLSFVGSQDGRSHEQEFSPLPIMPRANLRCMTIVDAALFDPSWAKIVVVCRTFTWGKVGSYVGSFTRGPMRGGGGSGLSWLSYLKYFSMVTTNLPPHAHT